ncbi:hypothetical protein GBAR_LOCUS19865 [Geodia barretti]|uniref:Uncharacterized protein n=1 Tax=Geodia barretti TaxID=519541 RepID=A0AA35ST48_GEOBA|nr:hypothetical protein GBAR_LOCUS19865 [Geodia barretti]
MVSPGIMREFQDIIKNSTYQLPLYPTTLLLATDIELTVDVPFIFHTLPTLIKFSYDPHITGGFGPFSFGRLHRASAGDMKFRVGVRDNKISITLPGTQLIGYVCDVVPQHPSKTAHEIVAQLTFSQVTPNRNSMNGSFTRGKVRKLHFIVRHTPLLNLLPLLTLTTQLMILNTTSASCPNSPSQ